MVEKLNFKDIKNLDAAAIHGKVSELRRNLFDLRMQKAASGLEKPHLIKIAKKNVAKLLTVLNTTSEK